MNKLSVEEEISKIKSWCYSANITVGEVIEIDFIGTKLNFSNDEARLILSNTNDEGGDDTVINILLDSIEKIKTKIYKEECFMPSIYITVKV